MTQLPVVLDPHEDIVLIKLAREIAINHFPVETILKAHQISPETWISIQQLPRFKDLLAAEIKDWNGALNTHERTKLKAAAMVEEYLPEGNSRLHDNRETLPAKVELLKLLTRIAGMGLTGAELNGFGGEKFSVTINLGADSKLKFEKEVTHQVIDVTPTGDA